MKEPFNWDNYSDQAGLLKDKEFKKKMRKKEFFSLFKTFCRTALLLPPMLLLMPFKKAKKIASAEFFTLGVDFQRYPKETKEMLKELNVKSVLLRIKLWEMQEVQELKNFLDDLPQDIKITLKIMQDREHIEDLKLLKQDLYTIFKAFCNRVDIFEIGTTINRTKWGFFSVDEYLKFYEVAYKLKEKDFNNINLIGSGVIDFEYHFTIHTLFNFYKLKYDGISSLLYVDRRGAPEHSQLGFNLQDKISLLGTMASLSPKTKNHLYITETNYPLSNTAPYAPTSEKECVDEDTYANFMLRYYLLAFATQQVEYVAWHQLIASGYGLVDARDGLRKRVAYDTFAFMLNSLRDAKFLTLKIRVDHYILEVLRERDTLEIHWSLKITDIKKPQDCIAYNKDGSIIKENILHISESPIYIERKL